MLHTGTVEPRTLDLLKRLMTLEILEPYYIVGGTSLALQIGHRISIDLDLFGKIKLDYNDLVTSLATLGKLEPMNEFDNVYQFEIDTIKVDIVNYRHSLINPILKIDGIRLASAGLSQSR